MAKSIRRAANECEVCGNDHARPFAGMLVCEDCEWLIVEARTPVEVK